MDQFHKVGSKSVYGQIKPPNPKRANLALFCRVGFWPIQYPFLGLLLALFVVYLLVTQRPKI